MKVVLAGYLRMPPALVEGLVGGRIAASAIEGVVDRYPVRGVADGAAVDVRDVDTALERVGDRDLLSCRASHCRRRSRRRLRNC